MARPATYSQDILDKARTYISGCIDDIEHKVVKIPTKGGLATALGVNRDTLYAWSKDHEEFSDIMEAMGAIQEDRLLNNGLAGTYNPTIAKVLLTKHGYRDAVDTDVTSKGESINIPNSEAIKLAKEYEEKLKKGL